MRNSIIFKESEIFDSFKTSNLELTIVLPDSLDLNIIVSFGQIKV